MVFCNFKAIPETPQDDLQSGKDRYNPAVSDVSDCEVVEPKDSSEKVSKVEPANHYAIFKPVAMRKAVREKIRQNHPGIQALNPACSELQMVDLGKRRWVCVSSVYLNFWVNFEKKYFMRENRVDNQVDG